MRDSGSTESAGLRWNAARIAGQLLLLTDAAIVELTEKKAVPAGGGGMDDMDY